MGILNSRMKIAICGKMCSGKTTLANYIMRTFPGYQKYSFAEKVKELCVELFDMKKKDRPLLIDFANKMREIDPNVWINQVLKQTNGQETMIGANNRKRCRAIMGEFKLVFYVACAR